MHSTGRHPRLFFNSERLPALRAKTEHPRFRRDWEAVKFQAEAALAKGPRLEEALGHGRFSEEAGRAARYAFIYRIAGEKRFADAARASILLLLDQERSWTHSPVDLPFGLREGMFCHQLALAYDLLADELPEAERRRFVETCHRRLIGVFLEQCRSPEHMYLSGNRTMNHIALHASGAGCLCLALDGDGVDLSKETEIARAHLLRFVEWYDDAGASLELGGYWLYGMGHALRALAAFRENGWPGIFQQRSQKLDRTAYPYLCMSIGGKFVTNFCDSNYGTEPHGDGLQKEVRGCTVAPGADPRKVCYTARTCALILAAEFQDPRLQWLAEQLPAGDELSIVCGDPDLPAKAPDDLPTTIVYHGCGVGILRSSMSAPDALFLGLKAGRARGHVYDDPHCQFDLNAVVLDAYGTTLLADPGYHHVWGGTMSTLDPKHISNSSPPHNTLLVGGDGQTHEDSPLAHLQDLSPSDEIDYLVSRIERGYGARVKVFDRHAYLIEKRLFVLIDDIELAKPEILTWNFHGKESAKIEAGVPARIEVEGARLDLIPFGGTPLKSRFASDHLLPRVQFDSAEPVQKLRAGWLLVVRRVSEPAPEVAAAFEDGNVVVRQAGRIWRLPVVPRRASFRSDIMLPFPERSSKLRPFRS